MRLHLAPRISGLENPINCCFGRRELHVAIETRLIVAQTSGHYSIDPFIPDRTWLKETSRGPRSHLVFAACWLHAWNADVRRKSPSA